MAHRSILTDRQREELFALPKDEFNLVRYYVLSHDDIAHINQKRGHHNRLGFALQLCAFRYPGRFIHPDEVLPYELLSFVCAQLEINPIEVAPYAKRTQTHYEHSIELKRIFGFLSFSDFEDEMITWLLEVTVETRNNAELAELFVQECRHRKIILPGITVIERLCADARVAAERQITETIVSRLDENMKENLSQLLEKTIDSRTTVYGWLKRFEAGSNSSDANRLLDKLEYLKKLDIPASILENIPNHRIIWLRQQGEAYFADGLRDLIETRRLAILATCAICWKGMIIDAVMETHDQIVGKLYNSCKRKSDEYLADQKNLANHTLLSFVNLGNQFLKGYDNQLVVRDVVQDREALEKLLLTAKTLTKKLSSEPLEYVLDGYVRFRRYTQRLLENMSFEGHQSAEPLLKAIDLLKKINQSDKNDNSPLPIGFFNRKWNKRLGKNPDRSLWETAIFFEIRDSLRSRDIWLPASHRYQDTKQQLLPLEQAKRTLMLPIPLEATSWIEQRRALLEQHIKQINRMIQKGTLPNSDINDGKIELHRLPTNVPEGIEQLTLELYKEIPQTSITQILQEVDEDTGFTDSFSHIHTGSPCPDKIGLLNVLLAGGINLGLKKMAVCSSSHSSFWTLRGIANWYITSETLTDALAVVIEKHRNLGLSSLWGNATTSSSDGQFFSTGGTGEAMNLVNARYGTTAGIKAYTHVSDQYGPFSIKTIPATAHEAPYILDGLTMNDAGKRIKEHYTDTGGFTEHVFGLCSLLGYQFAPRLRNLSSLQLYGMEGVHPKKALQDLITAKVNLNRIGQEWPDIIRLVASIINHKVTPSQILRELASLPRQNELGIALREIGRLERTLFVLNWIGSEALQRRAQMGLNKGEAHHALKRALNFNRRGEITDRTSENQHLRMQHLNFLTAIVIYWNTKHLEQIITRKQQQGFPYSPVQLSHLSPLGWEHIILTGFYKW